MKFGKGLSWTLVFLYGATTRHNKIFEKTKMLASLVDCCGP
jgi:hypothetical protein